jgi:outer membrane protein OmpA-like peptidoglycan-associated protein
MILRRQAAGGRFCRPSGGRGQLPPLHGSASRRPRPALRRFAPILILVLASFGCQNLDERPDAPASNPPAPADDAYPSLHSVPPRPQLSYPVRQQRAIMGELLADRDNARYTEQVIRHRAGLSTLPPPPGPPATDHEPAVEALIAAAPPVEPESAEPEPMGQQAPPRNVADIDRGNRDDGSLDDMIEGMVVEAEDDEPATAPAETRLAPSAGPQPAPTPPTAAPPQEMESETGPVSRLLDWLGGLVEGEEDRASVAVGPSPEAPEPRPLAAAAADAHPIEPAAGDAPAELAQEIAGPAPPEARPAGAPAPAPEASTITVAASGIGIVPAEPAGDPDPGVIAFARGSAALPPAALAKLERFLAEASVDDAPITVLGEGSPPALAIDRARAVGQALVSLGASAERLRITMATDGAGDRARLRLAAPAED